MRQLEISDKVSNKSPLYPFLAVGLVTAHTHSNPSLPNLVVLTVTSLLVGAIFVVIRKGPPTSSYYRWGWNVFAYMIAVFWVLLTIDAYTCTLPATTSIVYGCQSRLITLTAAGISSALVGMLSINYLWNYRDFELDDT